MTELTLIEGIFLEGGVAAEACRSGYFPAVTPRYRIFNAYQWYNHAVTLAGTCDNTPNTLVRCLLALPKTQETSCVVVYNRLCRCIVCCSLHEEGTSLFNCIHVMHETS